MNIFDLNNLPEIEKHQRQLGKNKTERVLRERIKQDSIRMEKQAAIAEHFILKAGYADQKCIECESCINVFMGVWAFNKKNPDQPMFKIPHPRLVNLDGVFILPSEETICQSCI